MLLKNYWKVMIQILKYSYWFSESRSQSFSSQEYKHEQSLQINKLMNKLVIIIPIHWPRVVAFSLVSQLIMKYLNLIVYKRSGYQTRGGTYLM